MLDMLTLIARFSHLRVKDVAKAFAWTECKARRQLNSLERDKLLLMVERRDRTKVFGLSATGRNVLKAKDQEAICSSSLKYLRSLGNYDHRCKANEVCIYYADAFRYSTEFEIQTCRAPVKSLRDKIPDALIYTDFGTIWVEVENSKRNETSWTDLVRWFILVFDSAYPEKPTLSEDLDLYIFRVEFYCDRYFQKLFFKRLSARVGEVRANDLMDCYTSFVPLDFVSL